MCSPPMLLSSLTNVGETGNTYCSFSVRLTRKSKPCKPSRSRIFWPLNKTGLLGPIQSSKLSRNFKIHGLHSLKHARKHSFGSSTRQVENFLVRLAHFSRSSF